MRLEAEHAARTPPRRAVPLVIPPGAARLPLCLGDELGIARAALGRGEG